jgi:hypothetical protein
VTAVADDGSATVSFTPPASSGSSAIVDYTVTATDLTDASRGGQQATGTGSPIAVGGLVNGDAYTFVVRAANGSAPGPRSAPSAAVTPMDPATPAIPFLGRIATTTTLVSSANPSAPDTAVTLTAAVAPLPDGGVVGFEIDGSGPIACAARPVDPATGHATCTVSDLTPGPHAIVAAYAGSARYAVSRSATLVQTVSAPTASAAPLTPARCDGPAVTLVDVRRRGARARVTGVTLPSAAGATVTVHALKDSARASARVRTDGSFSVSLALPERAAERRAVSYQATVQGHRSAAVHLGRAFAITRTRTTPSGVAVVGHVAGARGGETVTLQRWTLCGVPTRVTTVRLRRGGHFRVTLPRPKAGTPTSLYRAHVQLNGRRTYSRAIIVRAQR